MLTLELFISQCCPSCDEAIALAKKAVAEVPEVILVIRQADGAHRARAQLLGIVASPTFVLEGNICEVGVPSLQGFVRQLREGCRASKDRNTNRTDNAD